MNSIRRWSSFTTLQAVFLLLVSVTLCVAFGLSQWLPPRHDDLSDGWGNDFQSKDGAERYWFNIHGTRKGTPRLGIIGQVTVGVDEESTLIPSWFAVRGPHGELVCQPTANEPMRLFLAGTDRCYVSLPAEISATFVAGCEESMTFEDVKGIWEWCQKEHKLHGKCDDVL